ncbi:uncharacterized protein LOC119173010 [Rhipicephalus microplus]|uniref:uncharacterized protein LOC119173010 n=1 Tax=Rhipicephalus microplus TaxID=6941 RepID=UPI003F6D4BD6
MDEHPKLVAKAIELRHGVPDRQLMWQELSDALNHEVSAQEWDGYPMVQSDKLRENGVILEDLVCYYKEIYRNESLKKPDEEYLYGSRKRLLFDELLQKEFLFVECATRQSPDRPFHEQFLFNSLLKKTVEERCSTAFGTPHNMSVLVLGLDSVSYLNFDRHLPKTAKFVREKLDAFELYGYNKARDNSYPNQVLLILGLKDYEATQAVSGGFYDNLSTRLLWHMYGERGYRTMFLEESPHYGIFDYMSPGFQRAPADYYLRPIVMAMDDSPKITEDCNVSPVWDSRCRYADEPFRRHLETLHTSGTLNHTVLVFVSDHGMRFGDNRATYMGKFEDRQPFAFVVFPPWFLQKNPEAAQSLRTNQHHLTTHFDIHATLVELLD